mgnify:CR=1 FL=1
MRVTTRTKGDVTIVDLNGKITIGSGDIALRNAVHQAIESGANKLLINLHEVSTIDSSGVGELVSAGVVLSSGGEYGPGGPTYVFTKLNDLKPPMIAEATARRDEIAARPDRGTVGVIMRIGRAHEPLDRDRAVRVDHGRQFFGQVRRCWHRRQWALPERAASPRS